MKALGSIAAVIAAVREDASAEAEALEHQAQEDVERIRGEGKREVVTIPDHDARLAAARHDAQSRLGQEDWEDTREAVADREQWIARAVELGEQRLAEPVEPQVRRDLLAGYAREAIVRLPGRVFEVVVSASDVALLGPEWCAAVAADAGRDDVRVVSGQVDGGCIVRTPDGRASFDNTYSGRARRFQASWRSALADIYERATAATIPSTGNPTGV
jgi:vacuolar-type H+-ATPase subunit E/Vma4